MINSQLAAAIIAGCSGSVVCAQMYASVDDSSLWTEEFDELEYISLMDDDLEVLPLEPMLAPSRAPPPVGEGAIL